MQNDTAERRIVKLQEPSFGADEIAEALDSLNSTMVVMGEKCRRFESSWNSWQGSGHSVFVNSGSSANLVMIGMLRSRRGPYALEDGDEVLIPAVTWSTTLFPVMQLGLKPVLCDVDPRTFNIDLESCRAALTERTRAIFVVHLLGNPCDMDAITAFAREHDLILLEDCCESHGARWNGTRVGNFGAASSFSFMFAHHISTIEGGMVCTKSDMDYRISKSQRAHGWVREFEPEERREIMETYGADDDRFLFWDIGFNVRPGEINAAFGLHQMEKIDGFIERRRANLELYRAGVAPILDKIQIQEPADSELAWNSNFSFGFYITDPGYKRRDLFAFLSDNGIECRPLVAGNLSRHPYFDLYRDKIRCMELPNADKIHFNGLYLPNHQGMTAEDVAYVTDRLVEFFS